MTEDTTIEEHTTGRAGVARRIRCCALSQALSSAGFAGLLAGLAFCLTFRRGFFAFDSRDSIGRCRLQGGAALTEEIAGALRKGQ